jgi:hypothetical protein
MEVNDKLQAPAPLPLGTEPHLDGTHGPSGLCGEEKNLVHTTNRTPAYQPLARRCTD